MLPSQTRRFETAARRVRGHLGHGLLSLLVAVCSAAPTLAQPAVELPVAEQRWPVPGALAVAKDPDARWTLDQLEDPEGPSFLPMTQSNLGLVKGQVFARFRVHNSSDQTVHKVLELQHSAMLGSVELRVMDGDTLVERWYGGAARPANKRMLDTPNPAFALSFPAGSERTLLLHLEPQGSPLSLYPTLWDTPAFLREVQLQQAVLWCYFGFLLVMALYNLVLFVTLRESARGYLVGFIATNILMGAASWGITTQLLGRTDAVGPWFAYVPNAFLMLLFTQQFTRSALETRTRTPRCDRALRWFGRFYLLMALCSLGLEPRLAMQIFAATFAPCLAICTVTGLASAISGYRPARTYVATWAIVFACAGAYAMVNLGVMPESEVTRQVLRVAVAFQTLIFTLVLAQRVNMMRKQIHDQEVLLLHQQQERIAAQEELITIKQTMADRLSREVESRSRALSASTADAEEAREQAERATCEAAGLDEQLHVYQHELEALLETMQEGVFIFGPDLTVGPHWSTAAASIFGEHELSGKNVSAMLVDHMAENDPEHEVLARWLRNVFGIAPAGFDDYNRLAPNEVVLSRGTHDERVLQLDFKALVEHNTIEHVMCVVRDMSAEREDQAQTEMKAQKQRRAIRLLQGLSSGDRSLVRFFREGAKPLNRCVDLLEDLEHPLDDTMLSLTRDLTHRVKNEAGCLELESLAAQLEKLESELHALHGCDMEERARSRPALLTRLRESLRHLDEVRSELVELAPEGERSLEMASVDRRMLDELVHLTAPGTGTVADLVRRMASHPFEEVARSVVRSTPAWAADLGKGAMVDLQGDTVGVEPLLVPALQSALEHLIKNALEHGIESPDQRRALHKDPRGQLQLTCDLLEGDSVRVVLRDDGRGVDVPQLEERARGFGVSWDQEHPEELLFAEELRHGKESETGSSGGGLAKTRKKLAEAGYHVRMEPRESQGSLFVIEPLDNLGRDRASAA